MLERLAAMPDSKIDYSDIPPLSDEQLAQMASRRISRRSR